ncbi:MAG: phosphatase PAP2 family protein [Halanaeroarchaeum sp.]
MLFLAVLTSVVVVVSLLLASTTVIVLGTDQTRAGLARWRTQAGRVWRYVAVLGVVLVVNTFAREYGPRVSWMIDWNITAVIHTIEGTTVAWIQSFAIPPLTALLGAVYVYGYAFLVIFPLVGYFLLRDPRHFERTASAYAINYALGVVLYTLFVSYGPRNVMPDLVSPLLFSQYPESKLLTVEINANTNVFPSLHTSLATTVAILSWQTREHLPRWPPIAIPLALAVVVSTMYLGIHWVTDVVGGIVVAVLSVAVASVVVDRRSA